MTVALTVIDVATLAVLVWVLHRHQQTVDRLLDRVQRPDLITPHLDGQEPGRLSITETDAFNSERPGDPEWQQP